MRDFKHHFCVFSVLMFGCVEIAVADVSSNNDKIVKLGEVLSSRFFLEPRSGWELLIRHEGSLHVCVVEQVANYGFNGAPTEVRPEVTRCLSEKKEK